MLNPSMIKVNVCEFRWWFDIKNVIKRAVFIIFNVFSNDRMLEMFKLQLILMDCLV